MSAIAKLRQGWNAHLPSIVQPAGGDGRFPYISPQQLATLETTMKYDFNVLEKRARELSYSGRIADAMKIYYFMADGDPSLDGGYLAMKIAEGFEKLGDLHAAKYWYRRAVEENAARDDCFEALQRLEGVNIDGLIPPREYVIS
jgi:hypothetical protein